MEMVNGCLGDIGYFALRTIQDRIIGAFLVLKSIFQGTKMKKLWIRLDCAKRKTERGWIYCWSNGDGQHYEMPICEECCNNPAKFDSPKDLCESCWQHWFTEDWPN